MKPSSRSAWWAALLASICVVCCGIFIATLGNVALALTPLAALAVAAAIWRLPLRTSATALFFLSIATERQGDAGHLFKTPLFPLGLALNAKYSTITNVKALQFSGMDLLCLLLLVVALHRAAARSTIDGPRSEMAQTPVPLAAAAVLYAATCFLQYLHGLSTGGDSSVATWQLRAVAHLPLYFATFSACIRGPRDFPRIGGALLGGALCKVIFIVAASYSLRALPFRMEYISNHDDSMTFAAAMVLLLVYLNERTERGTLVSAAVLLPLLALAAELNARRLVWVDTAGALLVYGLTGPRTRLKRLLSQAFLAAIPVIIAYVAVGWTSNQSIFAPVKLVKSVVSSEADRSTLDRDVENYNLATSIPRAPLLGTGLGHEYAEQIPMDDISNFLPQYKSFPHNSLLGSVAFLGLLGFLGLCALYVASMFLGARAFLCGRSPELRTAAALSIATIVIFLNQCFGDMAMWTELGSILAGMAIAVAGKAATASGAWPSRSRGSVPALVLGVPGPTLPKAARLTQPTSPAL